MGKPINKRCSACGERKETKMYAASQLRHWREILLQMRDRLDVHGAQIRADATNPSSGERAGGLSNRPLHMADAASQEAEVFEAVGLAQNEASIIREIEDALTRIKENQFGVCEACGKPISRRRLEALPYARHCIACAEKIQSENQSASSALNGGG